MVEHDHQGPGYGHGIADHASDRSAILLVRIISVYVAVNSTLTCIGCRATVGFTVTTTVMILSPSVPDPYSDVIIPINAFINNTMASRVYRRLKLELLQEEQSSAPDPSTIEFCVPASRTEGQLSEPAPDSALFSQVNFDKSSKVGTISEDWRGELGDTTSLSKRHIGKD